MNVDQHDTPLTSVSDAEHFMGPPSSTPRSQSQEFMDLDAADGPFGGDSGSGEEDEENEIYIRAIQNNPGLFIKNKRMPDVFPLPADDEIPLSVQLLINRPGPMPQRARSHIIRLVAERALQYKMYLSRAVYEKICTAVEKRWPKLKSCEGVSSGSFLISFRNQIKVVRQKLKRVFFESNAGSSSAANGSTPKRRFHNKNRKGKRKLHLGPHNPIPDDGEVNSGDRLEHEENAKRLQEMVKGTASTESVSLMTLTYKIRRQEAGTTEVDKLLAKYPALKYRNHMIQEFERIVRDDAAAHKTKTSWDSIVPAILSVAKGESNSFIVKELLELGRNTNPTPYIIGKAALRILPRIVYGNKRGKEPEKYLFQSFQAGSTLADIISINKNIPTPYVVEIGGRSLTLTAESQPILNIEERSTGEIVCLIMAAYYVFNMHYAIPVLPALGFIQEYLMDRCDDLTSKFCRVRYLIQGIEYHKNSSFCE